MIRASALYISLILSLMIVLICGSVLLIGYTYRLEQKKQERSQILERNLESATVMVLQEDFKPDTLDALSLFGTETDTVMLAKRGWGLYELASIRAWINTDTLSRVFLMAPQLSDTLRALYLSDEDRPLSISGKSLIKGTAYLPKSGIRASYVDGSTYTDKTLVYGTSKFSERTMPVLDQDILQTCNTMFDELAASDKKDPGLPADRVSNSFFQPLRKVFVQGSQADLSGRILKGNLVIQCDTSLIVDASTILDQVILVAPHVLVKSGFKGNVQIFARDSITIADDVQLEYPSALLVLKADTAKFQIRIDIGKNSRISGQVIAYEKERSTLMPIISIGTGTVIQGELFSQGYLKFDRKTLVQGTVSAIRFMAKTSSSLYENYLIDTQINRRDLSRYYLGTKLLKGASTQNKILCWLK